MRARRQAAEAALGGSDVLPGDAQARASGDQNPSRYCINSQTSSSLSSRFVSRSFRNGMFFGRNLARTGASEPAKPEVAGTAFRRHIRRVRKVAPFSGPPSWGFAGAVLPPAGHGTPCFDARPREIPQGDPSSWANPSEPL